MPDPQQQLDELRRLVEREKCPECHGAKMMEVQAGVYCWKCHGTGLNQAYAALLEVVREPKTCTHSELVDDVPIFYKPSKCPGCHGSGILRYITRSIEGWPPKALEGALAYGIDHIIENYDNSTRWTRCYAQLIDMIDANGDTRLAALAAVKEALGGR